MGHIKVLVGYISRDFGGVESFFLNHCSKIDRDLITIDFLCCEKKAACEDAMKRLGSKIHYVTAPGENISKYYRDLEAVISNGSYNIFHLNLTRFKLPIDVILAKRFGMKVILHSHSTQVYKAKSFVGQSKRILEHYLFKGITLRNADMYMACSLNAKNFLFGKRKTHILYNGINSSEYTYSDSKRFKIRDELNLNENIVIGHIGRMSSEKNHGFIIKIFQEIYKINKQARLLLVGDGDLKESLKNKVKEMNLEPYVIFTGIRHDVADLLSAMDVFLFPSIHEALPISLLEAQASGLRCVVSDKVTKEIDVTRDIIFISLDEDIKCWVQAVIEQTKSIRVNNKEKMMKSGFDISDTIIKLQDIYNSIIIVT
ncbi:MAG: glycosyltransferase [Clostridium sp.]